MQQPLFTLQSQAAVRRPRVLLVEDHPANRQAVRIMLGDRVELHVAVHGQEGVEAYRDGDFDAVLMDTDMPVLSGADAVRAIRADEVRSLRAPTHIILLTCATAEDPEAQAAACGADQYLARPITEDGLIAAIRRATGGGLGDESLAMLGIAA